MFSWKSPSDCGHSPARGTAHLVSILVFVEVALGHPRENGVELVSRGFNPCFRGSRPRTPTGWHECDGSTVFQSLFSWKSPSDIIAIGVLISITKVSILVFVEVALGHPGAGTAAIELTCFNPCFRGSRPRTQAVREMTEESNCFNPCFRGSRPRTVNINRVFFISSLFQSLFSWKSPSDFHATPNKFLGVIVSILVFVEVALGLIDIRIADDKEVGFNPCFRGSRPRTQEPTILPGHLRVSILVFVEVALGLSVSVMSCWEGVCFNPCFRGSRPRTSV